MKQRNRGDGGRAERMLRGILWRRGLRYRIHAVGLPGHPDLVFSRVRLAVFVDGDFWHGRNWPGLKERLRRRANPDYWIPKIERNRERDAEQGEALKCLGWRVLRVWETDVLADVGAAADLVQAAYDAGATPQESATAM